MAKKTKEDVTSFQPFASIDGHGVVKVSMNKEQTTFVFWLAMAGMASLAQDKEGATKCFDNAKVYEQNADVLSAVVRVSKMVSDILELEL